MKSSKVAVVTGGCCGIGAAISTSLSNDGFNIAIIDTDAKRGKEISKRIENTGGQCFFLQADVSDFAVAQHNLQEIPNHFGAIHVLVNNAGINRDGVIWKMTEEQWDEVINVNLKGYFNYIRAVSPIFKKQQFGKIINISSINGMRGKFGQANYAASKAGIIGLTKAVATELGKYGITVNAVAPGMVRTAMAASLPPEIVEKAKQESVLQRIAEPEDIAAVVAFLSSEGARHITGEIIKVDGGQYI